MAGSFCLTLLPEAAGLATAAVGVAFWTVRLYSSKLQCRIQIRYVFLEARTWSVRQIDVICPAVAAEDPHRLSQDSLCSRLFWRAAHLLRRFKVFVKNGVSLSAVTLDLSPSFYFQALFKNSFNIRRDVRANIF